MYTITKYIDLGEECCCTTIIYIIYIFVSIISFNTHYMCPQRMCDAFIVLPMWKIAKCNNLQHRKVDNYDKYAFL